MNKVYTSLDDFAAWELEAYADGEIVPHVAAFFKEQPTAYQAWQKAQQVEKGIKVALNRFDCPPPNQLHAYIWHELSAAAEQTLQAHLKICPVCTAELASLQSFLQTNTPLAATAAPAPAAHQGFWEQLHDVAEQVRLAIATLVTPSLAGVALRSTPTTPGTSTSGQIALFFEIETTVISLLVARTAIDTVQMAGQLLGTIQPVVGVVQITAADPALARQTTPIDEVGNFIFQHLSLGSYQMVIKLPEQTIVIPNLNLT